MNRYRSDALDRSAVCRLSSVGLALIAASILALAIPPSIEAAKVCELVRDARAEARKWQRGAVLVEVSVFAGSDGTVDPKVSLAARGGVGGSSDRHARLASLWLDRKPHLESHEPGNVWTLVPGGNGGTWRSLPTTVSSSVARFSRRGACLESLCLYFPRPSVSAPSFRRVTHRR
jgi:hypothetical protein